MSDNYVVLFVRGKAEKNEKVREVLNDFKEWRIKHRIVDLTEEIQLYGNKVTLEGAFAIDFSKNGRTRIPVTPFATAGGKIFSGSDKIKENLTYLSNNYPDE